MAKDFDTSSAEERKLRELLRREATESRPPFSEAFHRRMVHNVFRFRTEKSFEPNRTSPWPLCLATALAAACLLGVAVFGWRPSSSPPQQDDPDRSPLVVSTDPTSPPAQLAQLDHLEHDARLAMNMLLQRLPIDVELAEEP